MFNAEKYIAEYQDLDAGTARLRAIKKAYLAADEAHNDEWSFRFRDRYINESTFESDDVDALVVFPEMIALYDGSAELQADDDYFYKLMWCFKYIIENATEFYHIPRKQIDSFLDEFKARLERAGRSLRTYYYLREKVSKYYGDLFPQEEYGKYRDIPADDLKDCSACEASHDVQVALLFDQPEKARELCQPIFSGELHCGCVPESTFAAWIEYDIRKGEFADAKKLAKRIFPLVKHRIDMLAEIGIMLHLYSIIDRQIGVTLFRHELRNFLDCRNHWMRYYFAAGAYRLFDNMKLQDFPLFLPQEFPLWNESHHYQREELRKYFYDIAKELAEKLDARNGNTALTDALHEKDPEFDDEAVDLIHADTEQTPSAIGAVCSILPDELTVESVKRKLENDGRYAAVLSHVEEEQGLLAFQIAEGGTGNIYQVMLICQPVPPVEDFRPASPIADNVAEAVQNAEGVVLCLMPFEEKQPDLALHFQLRFLSLMFPEAVAFLDYSRRKLLPASWVTLAAQSNVPPLIDYLYNLQLHGNAEDDHIWISTQGLRCCGLREIEILDATKENYPRYCDLLCFAAERILLRNEMSDAREPFSVLQKADNTPLVCTWVPVSEAKADYPADHAGCMPLRMEMLGESAEELDGNAVLFLYDGEAEDGTPKRRRLDTITNEEFELFRYGAFIATSAKIEALAQERYGIFAAIFSRAPENAYVCIRLEADNEQDEVWLKVTAAEENQIKGLLAEDCIAGAQGTEYTAVPAQLTDFSVRLDENLVVHPNTAYIALEIE